MKYETTRGFHKETYDKLQQMEIHPRTGYMPLAYICSPFAGDEVENMAKAKVYSRFALLNGYIPVTPHIYFPCFCFEESEREQVMKMNMVCLGKCHEVWVFGENITAGMKAEIERASKNKKVTIRYFTTDLKEKEL